MINKPNPYQQQLEDDFAEKNLDLAELKKVFGFEVSDLQKLAGFLGLASHHPVKKWSCTVKTDYPNCMIILKSEAKDRLYVTINIKGNFISNDLIVIKQPAKGTGLRLVKSQVEYATEAGFNKIELEASDTYATDDREDRVKLEGYRIWFKFGYTMLPSSLKRFHEIIDKKGWKKNHPQLIPDNILALHNIKGGPEFWKEFGETWYGLFDLSPNNDENRKILSSYIEKKRLEGMLI